MSSSDRSTTPSSEDSLGIDIRKASDQMLAHWLLKQLCGYDDRDIVSDRERDESFVAEIIGRVKTSIALSESTRTFTLTTDQQQRGVGAYQQWKANVSNPASSAFGGNLHDLARRMFEAMSNVVPQEISAEASSRADGEASAAKKPGATASTRCQPGEAETPCGTTPLSAGQRTIAPHAELRIDPRRPESIMSEGEKRLPELMKAALAPTPHAHDWQPDGGVVRFESHPHREEPHVHTTCSKCGARAWFLEYQWELLAKGCSTPPSARGAIFTEQQTWAETEKAKADAYEAAAVICEEMSYPPEGRERWANKDEEWAAIKLEDAAKAIRERKAKVCQVTHATVGPGGDK